MRGVVVGLLVGTVLCFTNMYFGLQTGWVTMGSIQCALVGFLLVRPLASRPGAAPFGPRENVLIQTIGVATATMPLAGGFVGIVPALAMLTAAEGGPITLSPLQLLVWCAALTYFGIFFAVPLRRQTILVEQLRFPSGTATAKLIEVLHATRSNDDPALRARWRALLSSFAASFAVSASAFFVPALQNLRVASWVGVPALTRWHWTVRPTLSLVGQGMIMGGRPAFSMLGGAAVGWALLGPLALGAGWVSQIDSWESGAQGWVLWVAIALMLAEALTSFTIVVLRQCAPLLRSRGSGAALPGAAVTTTGGAAGGGSVQAAAAAEEDRLEVAPPHELVPTRWWAGGLAAATVLCVAVVGPLFSLAPPPFGVAQWEIPAWEALVSVCLSCLIALLAVRALGQTDLNPVSAVGKLSQILFAVLAPGRVVTNVVAGALAEAGAMQAGDLMQDLKTGHLLGASPRVQFYGQLIGSTASIFVTVGAYVLYQEVYGVPSAQFAAPVAFVWKDMAILMQRGLAALPPSALHFAAAFGTAGVALPLLEEVVPPAAAAWLPSGVSVGVGMYLTPDWTLPRAVGAAIELAWRRRRPQSHEQLMLMVASGFVLGEGVWSICGLALKAVGAPTLGS